MKKTGVLITNLGTPDAPTKSALRTYLKEFLSDKRVVEPPPSRWLWLFVLNAVILNIRPKNSAKAYESVWGKFGEGSPLLDISIKQLEQLRTSLGDDYQIELGMRYGNPSISSALGRLTDCNKLIVLPLYPQYSAATTGSTFDALSYVFQNKRVLPELRFIDNYHSNSLYTDAIKNSITSFQEQNGRPDLLIFSYHGMPKRYVENGDIYQRHCIHTTKIVAKKLGLADDDYMICYQSIFGREEWLKPYLSETLKSLPAKGVTNVQVICPGFSSDCLETIEEIEEENKEYFMDVGGKQYSYIPALNDSEEHIKCLAHLIQS